jgi:hypothetical protein
MFTIFFFRFCIDSFRNGPECCGPSFPHENPQKRKKFFVVGPVIERFSSPYAILHRGPYSISLCRLIFPVDKIQRQKLIFFHMYASCTLYNMCIRRLLHYNPRTSGFVPKNEN